MTLSSPISQLSKVGAVLQKRLQILGIETFEDLLWYFPFRYEDYSNIISIETLVSTILKEGKQQVEGVTIKGKIEMIANKRSARKRAIVTEAIVTDGTDRLRVVWFGQPFISKTLKVGDEIYLSGKVTNDLFGVQMKSPTYEKIKSDTESAHAARIIPVYSLTAGMTQKQMQSLTEQVVLLVHEVGDWLPEQMQQKAGVIALPLALKEIHNPSSEELLRAAEKRLKFDEIFVLQLRAEMIRQSLKRASAPVMVFKEEEIRDFVATLPYELTKDQKIVAWEIMKDLERPEPMNRLLEGDVGSGKTVVAALTAYDAIVNGYQVAVMAPTEVLAKQHFETLKQVMGGRVRIALITANDCQVMDHEFVSKSQKKQRQEMEQLLQQGKIHLLIGTHALLTDSVVFQSLGYVVVDEQHRFGVEQRRLIREKSGLPNIVPHFLSMTATPIPRSFALTLYGDLDISMIKQMPAGRKQIKTRIVEPKHREKAYQFIREQVAAGRQVFVICPLIEEGTTGMSEDKKTVMSEYERLRTTIFPDLAIGFLHGKLKSSEKDETMRAFSQGETDILVSTSVVEVGVNVPNATVMMIEGADRFGLAQLHQFRGRVGRSEHQSYCFLFTDNDSQKARERLQMFEKTTDGFALAEFDLEQRGPGEVYGKHQSGMMQFRLATMKDLDIITLARDIARGIDFSLFPELAKRVKRWEEQTHLE